MTAGRPGPTSAPRVGCRRTSASHWRSIPANPDRAFVIPLASSEDRVTPEGKVRVYETSDRGATWKALSRGLPQQDAYLTVLRQAFCQDGRDPLGLYFGCRTGEVFGSADGGESWSVVADRLPPVLSVQASK